MRVDIRSSSPRSLIPKDKELDVLEELSKSELSELDSLEGRSNKEYRRTKNRLIFRIEDKIEE